MWGVRAASQPLPGPRTREPSTSCEQEGTAGRAGVRKAAVQQAAGRFLDRLLRHATMVRRTLRAGPALPAAARGKSVPLSFPSVTTNPQRATCPVRDQMGSPWRLGELLSQG